LISAYKKNGCIEYFVSVWLIRIQNLDALLTGNS